MNPLDYGRSFVTFETKNHLNNARLQVEARCRLQLDGGAPEEYLLFASCKSEHTFAERDLFKYPNYDFCGIFGPKDYQIIRTHITADKGGRETGVIADRFHEVRVHLTEIEGAETLEGDLAVARASLANRILVGRTELRYEGHTALLEYPIKTMNANAERPIWQVDTGPLIVPDWKRGGEGAIAAFDLAFVVYHGLDEAEFILRRPKEIAEHAPPVEHYGTKLVTPARNSLLAG